MAETDLLPAQRAIIKGAHSTSRLLQLSALLALAVALDRLLGRASPVAVGPISVSPGAAWLLLGALTVAHVFLAVFLSLRIDNYLRTCPASTSAGAVFDEVTSEGNPFVYGLVPRAMATRPGGRFYRMSWRDPSTWVSYASLVLLAAALLPWHFERLRLVWQTGSTLAWAISLTFVLSLVNWVAGGLWLVALSQLDARRRLTATLPGGPLTDREFEWLLRFTWSADNYGSRLGPTDVYRLANCFRRLAEQSVPTGTAHPRRPGSRDALSLEEQRQLARTYLDLCSLYPGLRLPDTPWFVTPDDQADPFVFISLPHFSLPLLPRWRDWWRDVPISA